MIKYDQGAETILIQGYASNEQLKKFAFVTIPNLWARNSSLRTVVLISISTSSMAIVGTCGTEGSFWKPSAIGIDIRNSLDQKHVLNLSHNDCVAHLCQNYSP